jgi:hypothetical protein
VQARQRPGGEWLRIRRHGILVGMVRTVPELARIVVDLADISEALAWRVALDFREVA